MRDDLELGFPGANILMGLGRVGRPVLEPLAIRTTPVPGRVRIALIAGRDGRSHAGPRMSPDVPARDGSHLLTDTNRPARAGTSAP